MLEVKNLQKSYDNFNIAVDFTIAKGEFFSLLGPSGCGKTTTLRLIAGLEDCDSGSIKLSGLDITKLPPQKRNLGLVFQDYALFPHLSVTENILYGLRKEKREIKERRLLALFKLEDLKDRSVRRLSGGESQRVALARALAVEPNLLLLDEPFAALDPALRQSLREELKELQKTLGLTIVFVTHNQEEALSLSDRIALLENGRIVQMGTPFEIYTQPNSPYVASFFGQVNLVQLEVKKGQIIFGSTTLPLEVADGIYQFAIRPEHLQIGGGVRGRIIKRSYLGFAVEYLVATNLGELRYLDFNPNSLRENGSEIELSLRKALLV